MKAIAFDEFEELTDTLSVAVADIPCTIPTVNIVNGIKAYSQGHDFYKPQQIITETVSDIECNITVTVE